MVIVCTVEFADTASRSPWRITGALAFAAGFEREEHDCGRWSEYARRLPSSFDDLKGPAAGKVELPLHVAWSGRRVFDVGTSGSGQRLVLYALLPAEAQREDLEQLLHGIRWLRSHSAQTSAGRASRVSGQY